MTTDAGERDTTEAGEGLAPMIERLIRRYEDRLHEAVVPPDQVAWAIYTGVVSDLRDALAARPAPVTGKVATDPHHQVADCSQDNPNEWWVYCSARLCDFGRTGPHPSKAEASQAFVAHHAGQGEEPTSATCSCGAEIDHIDGDLWHDEDGEPVCAIAGSPNHAPAGGEPTSGTDDFGRVLIPADDDRRRQLGEAVGLTPEELSALDAFAFREAEKRQRGVLTTAEAEGGEPTSAPEWRCVARNGWCSGPTAGGPRPGHGECDHVPAPAAPDPETAP